MRLANRKPGSPATARTTRAIAMQMLRAAVLVAIVGLIHDDQQRHARASRRAGGEVVSVAQARLLFPSAARVATSDSRLGLAAVFDATGLQLGSVTSTSPAADSIVGYAGPTNLLIGFDVAERIVGVRILSSEDTVQHVDAVRGSEAFLASWNGLRWDEAAVHANVDAVSGATLTSLAAIDSVLLRLCGDALGGDGLGRREVSSRFPHEPAAPDLREWLPQAVAIVPRASQPRLLDVNDASGVRIGAVLRSSPEADRVMGYQGPTDCWLILDEADRGIGFHVAASFDNEPYVGYVRDDRYFPALYVGKSLAELAALAATAEQVEGVSGATMTSQAVALSVPQAAQAALRPVPARAAAYRLSGHDIGTILMVLASLAVCFTRLKGHRSFRRVYLVVLVAYFGLLNGDLLSQTALVGWARHGLPWRVAPGLVAVAAAAILTPAMSRRQLYCHHLCPFGAAQQLVRPRAGKGLVLPRPLRRILELIPAGLLALVLAATLLRWPLNLAGIEPFDAFAWQTAGWAAIAIALAGWIASRLVPMAYCRYGCPTGAVLDYLRWHSRSHLPHHRDAAAALLLVLALVLWNW